MKTEITRQRTETVFDARKKKNGEQFYSKETSHSQFKPKKTTI